MSIKSIPTLEYANKQYSLIVSGTEIVDNNYGKFLNNIVPLHLYDSDRFETLEGYYLMVKTSDKECIKCAWIDDRKMDLLNWKETIDLEYVKSVEKIVDIEKISCSKYWSLEYKSFPKKDDLEVLKTKDNISYQKLLLFIAKKCELIKWYKETCEFMESIIGMRASQEDIDEFNKAKIEIREAQEDINYYDNEIDELMTH